MRTVLLVAGVDYEFTGVDFRVLADARRRFVERRNTAKADLRFVTMDVRAGEIEEREITFAAGKRVEKVTSTKPHDPVGRASYTTVAGHTRFKPGQVNVMGITDIYARVRAIGAAAAGTLGELSFFSHGWMGGPILVNSDDDGTYDIVVPIPMGSPITVPISTNGLFRDLDDKDARGHLDFTPPTMDAAELTTFRAAFAGDGIAWLWGCAFPKTIHHTLWAIERAKGYNSTTLGDDVVLTLPDVEPADVDSLDRWLAGVRPPFPAPRSVISAKFKHLRYAMCRANTASYAARLAAAANVPVHAAPLGTYSEYDSGGDELMNVHSGFVGHFAFYKNHLGFSFDPEGRRYGVYRPGLACPAPPP